MEQDRYIIVRFWDIGGDQFYTPRRGWTMRIENAISFQNAKRGKNFLGSLPGEVLTIRDYLSWRNQDVDSANDK
jgi:hypothetical protein